MRAITIITCLVTGRKNVDANTKEVLLALVACIGTGLGYYFGYIKSRSNNKH
jgi:Na+-transporting NADH:ubiquinone oxidoreductase subunit NqrD